MTYYAFLDEDNIVTEIIVGRDENDIVDGITNWVKYYSDFRNQKCIKILDSDKSSKKIAGIGFEYDEVEDVFIPPKPFDSWIFNETSFMWEAPIDIPNDGNRYYWDETTQEWKQIN